MIRSENFKRRLKSIAAQKGLTCLDLNLNNTNAKVLEMIDLMNAVKKNKSLEEVALKI